MSRYKNQYGNYYDPVGSQSSQPSGYTYQTSTSGSSYPTAATSSGYGANYQGYGANAYGSQQYGSTGGQQSNTSASHAAQALSSLSGQGYSQASSPNRASSSDSYDNSSWFTPGQNSSSYSGSNMALPNRSQSNNSPLYASTGSSSTFGRLSVPEESQNSSNTFGATQSYQNAPSSAAAATNRSYQTAYTQPQSQPPRYNRALHAVQAQQHNHNKQASRSSNHLPSPQMAQTTRSTQQNRQQSASVEPPPFTVDPSHVYDNRAELHRKAQIEAEKRRKYEAEQAAKRAEEERIAAEKRKEEEEEKRKADAEAAKKKAEQDKKNAQRKKAREEKKQSKSAATTLQQMASSMAEGSAGAGGNDEEAQMREMFKKMREFNAKNPAMLAKLWDEERRSHEAAKASPTAPSKTPAAQRAPAAASPTATKSASARPAQQQAEGPATKPPVATSPSAQKAAQPTVATPTAPVTGQGTTSLWPHHKKGALSEATAKWLMSLPQNAGKSISPEVVLNILNSNPSYVQLCESLEGFGLRFERSTLARELLKAVPDGLKAQPVPKAASPLNTSAQVNGVVQGAPDPTKSKRKSKKNQIEQQVAAAPGTVNYEAPLSLSDAARAVNSMDDSAYQPTYGSPDRAQASPYFTQSQTLTNGSRPPSQSQPLEVKREDKMEEPPRPPADKEEAARKRTFGDLVDLTAEDSDDEGLPPKKIMQPPTAPVNGAPPQQVYLQQPTSFQQFMFKKHGQSIPVPGQGMMHPPRAPTANMTLPSNMPSHQQPNGQAPTMQQPPVVQQPPVKPRGPTAEQLQQQRMKGKMLVEPIMRDRVARKSNYDSRTIATDVLLATGRHPDMRGLNAHLANTQKLLSSHGGEFDSGGNRSDLSTIRWDIIDPVRPKKSKDEKDDDGKLSASAEPPTPRTAAARDLSFHDTVEYQTPSLSQSSPKKRRGRPPRSSLPDSATGPLTNSSLGANTPRQTSSRPATPSSAPAPGAANMSSSVGYATFNQVGPDGKKKKGRPFGWRKDVHSREAQGLPKAYTGAKPSLPSRLKQSTPAAVGRPPKQEQILDPLYQVYRCEWAGCKAELHNLDTLKKHLVKVHGKKDEDEGGAYKCWWKDCKAQKRPEGKQGVVEEVPRFEDIEPWIQHIDAEHWRPIAWKLGDGPGGSGE